MLKKTQKAFDKYCLHNKIKKLHLGAGTINLDTWFNTDLSPKVNEKIYYLNMLKIPYFFDDNTFDYIFSEHNFEHFTLEELYKILKECIRVLKPDGIIRIAIPDLNKIIKFYQEENTTNTQYKEWGIKTFIPFAHEKKLKNKAIVLNNFFRDWGHKFIYDYETIYDLLKVCGYKEITECKISKSRHKDLTNIENHWKVIGKNYNNLETMIIEAKK